MLAMPSRYTRRSNIATTDILYWNLFICLGPALGCSLNLSMGIQCSGSLICTWSTLIPQRGHSSLVDSPRSTRLVLAAVNCLHRPLMPVACTWERALSSGTLFFFPGWHNAAAPHSQLTPLSGSHARARHGSLNSAGHAGPAAVHMASVFPCDPRLYDGTQWMRVYVYVNSAVLEHGVLNDSYPHQESATTTDLSHITANQEPHLRNP
jgi:hypothetical protein